MEKSAERLEILKKIEEYEREEKWACDVENDPPAPQLLPDKVDYLQRKLSSKLFAVIANEAGRRFFEKMIKEHRMIIKEVRGEENLEKVNGAIVTCNHFNMCDNYAVYKAIHSKMKTKVLYKVIREGNYTNFPGIIGFFFRHCNTLPLSSNRQTMRKFLTAVSTLLHRGEKILIYPEQGMWWNYKKPRPMQPGAFNLAVTNNAPVLPVFITMEDSAYTDTDGFPVQAYTVHILPAIYPSTEDIPKKEKMQRMCNANYEAWKSVYEEFYHTKLVYHQ